MYELKDKEFEYISKKIYNYAKINLTEKKRSLVISRLSRRIRYLGLGGFTEYIKYLDDNEDSGEEFQNMVDAISTNYSLFFREPHHFDFLVNRIFPEAGKQNLNIWSAAASTGQEVYSVLITLLEYQKKTGHKFPYELYASDISTRALKTASRGIYKSKDAGRIDAGILKQYFLSGKGSQNENIKIKNDLIKQVRFFKLNLDDLKYRLPIMDVIFLRNVVIYFDKSTKTELINHLYDYIRPGGYLFLGHSESLSGISNKFAIRGKTVYQRKD